MSKPTLEDKMGRAIFESMKAPPEWTWEEAQNHPSEIADECRAAARATLAVVLEEMRVGIEDRYWHEPMPQSLRLWLAAFEKEQAGG